MKISRLRKQSVFIVILAAFFLFRLAYGLSLDFRPAVGDERQIYLIGLKFYTTHAWPYFGPDVTPTMQIPGALQGLVAGGPFFVLPLPEAPYILINLLSFASLCFFAWYCAKRLPEIPAWLIWSWMLTAPWTLNLSTQVYNPSYVLCGAILFFVGVIETYPFLTHHLIPARLANLMMGLALFWVIQFHLSWVLLVPYLLLSFYYQYREQGRGVFRSFGWFAGGAIITGSFLVPTFLKYGVWAGLGSTDQAAQVNQHNLWQNLNIVEGILGRFLSFASFEVPRFIGVHTADRIAFLRTEPWLIPFTVFLTVTGILQAIALFVLWFRKQHARRDWTAIKYLTLSTVIVLYISFLFSFKAPASHTFYITFPVAMLYSLYCWAEYLTRPGWRKFAATVIVCGIIFHLGLAIHNYPRVSLYRDRRSIEDALERKDYRLLDDRRPGTRY
jgi:hypothetical protein